MLTLSVGAETKSKRLRSHRQLRPHRQRLEFRAISNSFSSLVRITETDHGLNITMKKLFPLPMIICLTIFGGCQKQQIEEERNAEIERQVQQRLAAEHQTQEKQHLAQREAELDAREKALAEKQNPAAAATPVPRNPGASIARQMTDANGNPAMASYSTFYRNLEPYGVWRETSNYGYVWQPRETERSHGWRPYTNGRWVYTDAGWTWVSEEPFGWATYHYGRWVRLRKIGWVWVPGDEWAPAWVSWRKSNDYVGWAPLPPEAGFDRSSGIGNWADNYYDIGPDQYCFVPTDQFGTRRVETAVIPAERNVTIVNQTTSVTNISYSNTMIVNHGPNYDELRARTQQPIERLRLERQTALNLQAENPRPVVRGEVIEMPAPLIAKAQPAERPRNIKETVAQTIIDHGWEAGGDREATEKARAKIKSESTPPNAPPKTFVKPAQAVAEPIAATPTSTPAFASPTISATQARSRRPTPTPRKAVPAQSPQIPGPSATIAQSATPFRRASPSAIPSLAPTSTLPITATPIARETAPITPQGTSTPGWPITPTPSSPLPAAPGVLETPSVTPTNAGSTLPSPVGGHSTESKDQRQRERELKKQQQASQEQRTKDEVQKERKGEAEKSPRKSPATPLISPTTTPVFSSPSDSSKKEEKKNQKRERAKPGENVSPSPSVEE
jgi:hypothetical protein